MRFKETKLKKANVIYIVISVIILLGAGVFFYNKYKRNASYEQPVAQNLVNKGLPIAMALDDNYVYPTIVAITSAMENKNAVNEYTFYLMHPSEFKDENKEKVKSLEKKYDKCHIHFINMGEQFKNANDKGHITTPAYYRLALSDLLVNLDKMIWLDGDTLILQDLTQMYDIDMEGLYYRGYLDDNVYGAAAFGVETDHYICSGVMLINLKELRKDNMVKRFNDFIKQNNSKLVQHDQTVINVVCADKIGILPPKFGMFNISATKERCIEYSDILIAKDKYTHEDMLNALNNLCVLHCVTKPWKEPDVNLVDLWWYYARKTDFYYEIKEAYPIF
ncbi:MAG: glycosyltransferase family 8 protein [Clostridia bacterium]|nr:glycosyltransferase family 8 protein [Clostridia bacterium]